MYLFIADIFAEIFEEKIAEFLVEDFIERDISHLLQVFMHNASHTATQKTNTALMFRTIRIELFQHKRIMVLFYLRFDNLICFYMK